MTRTAWIALFGGLAGGLAIAAVAVWAVQPSTSKPSAAPAQPHLNAEQALQAKIAADIPGLHKTVASMLRDPSSAIFRNVWVVRSPEPPNPILYCGEVSGRNAYGGYGDSIPFFGTPGEAWLAADQIHLNVYKQFCEGGEKVVQVEM